MNILIVNPHRMLLLRWYLWLDWYGFGIFDPSYVDISPPDTFVIFEDPAVVMPESLISSSNLAPGSLPVDLSTFTGSLPVILGLMDQY